jgi:hypothetical protein
MAVYSGFWNGIFGANHALTGAQQRQKRAISRIMEKPGNRKLRGLMLALNGAAAGGTATVTHKQIAGPASTPTTLTALGGLRTVETVTDVNRATTAADETNIDQIINDKFAPASYPADRSGRRSGGNVGRI